MAALSEVTEALRAYEQCVAASGARYACSVEFSDLDLAQDGFESAVTEYAKGCQ